MRKLPIALVATAAAVSSAPMFASAAHATGHLSDAAGAAKTRVVQDHLCDHAAPGQARCMAIRLTSKQGKDVDAHGHYLSRGLLKQPMSAENKKQMGLSPDDIRSAYNLNGAKSGGKTVAIVDAFGYSKAESDLATYRKQYGLPACTTSNGCLTIMNQRGEKNSPPKDDDGWDGEQALDLDAVSAACPDCKILLVQADSADDKPLGEAENTAAKQPGVVAMSNSFGGDDAADSAEGQDYNHPGIAVTASTGDDGYKGPSFPASSGYVTAVGGTSLSQDSSSRGWGESAWSGAGSGCAKENKAPKGQDSAKTGCTGRAMADVSAVADPETGLATYYNGEWGVVGGTSLSSPLVAAMFAMSGNTQGMANSIPYAHASKFNDVTDGSNGSCTPSQWCKAGEGWDGPTGIGSPNGVGGL